MLKKKIRIEGIDRDYKLTVALCTAEETERLAGKPCGACFIDDVAYFSTLTDDCVAHECLHITFEYIRKAYGSTFAELLDKKDIVGEEAIAFSFSDVYTQVKNVLRELQYKKTKKIPPEIGFIIPPSGGSGTVK